MEQNNKCFISPFFNKYRDVTIEIINVKNDIITYKSAVANTYHKLTKQDMLVFNIYFPKTYKNYEQIEEEWKKWKLTAKLE